MFLSTGQEQALARWRDHWLRVRRAAFPGDRNRAEAALSELYLAAGHTPPTFVWMQSPRQALVALGALHVARVSGFESSNPLLDPHRDFAGWFTQEFGGGVWSRLHELLTWPIARQEASKSVWDEAVNGIKGLSSWAEVWNQCQARHRETPLGEAMANLGDGGRTVRRWLHDEIQTIEKELGAYGEEWSDALWLGCAQPSVEAVAQEEFCAHLLRRVHPPSATERKLFLLATAARTCGAWWPRRDVCVMSEKPTAVHCDRDGQLHHPSSAALRFADGFCVRMWRGTRVPESWLTSPETLDPTRALDGSIRGAQQRAFVEIVGWKRVIETMAPQLIDHDADPAIGELLEVVLPPDPSDGLDGEGWIVTNFDELPSPTPRLARFLKVRCGTDREFVLSVPLSMRTAREANAWTYGLEPHELRLEART